MICNGSGEGCKACMGAGHFLITADPWVMMERGELSRDMLDVMKFARMAEHHLPLSGGVLDQTQSFIDALDWINHERRKWKAEAEN